MDSSFPQPNTPIPPQSAQDSPTQAVAIIPTKAPRKKQALVPVKSRLSKKTRLAIELWIGGAFPTQRALAEHCNISEAWLCKVLNREEITAFILSRTRQRIAQDVPVMRSRLMQLLEQDDNRGVAKDAVMYGLGTAGIAPARGPGIQINIASGLDINLD